jgi:site-specific DNA-methyltransferase (adenine-specific)
MMEYQLYNADCLDVLPTLAPGSVDAVICDPPYFLPATHYNVRSRVFRSLSDVGILEHFFRDFFIAVRRVLKPDGFLYAFCDGQSYPVFYATAYPHFRRLRPLIWDKVTSFNGYSWRHQHELILFAESDESPAVKTGDGDIIKCRAVPIDDREHLAEKPTELLRKLIEKTTPPNGIVIDPFMGSGTTGHACGNLGRRFIGIEKDAGYFAIAEERIATAYAPLRHMQQAI